MFFEINLYYFLLKGYIYGLATVSRGDLFVIQNMR